MMRRRTVVLAALVMAVILCGCQEGEGCRDLPPPATEAPAAITPRPTPPPTPAPTPSPVLEVRTDWSALTPYEPDRGVYTRRWADRTDTLIPADDYGPLIPFLGDIKGGNLEGCRYGLMTLEGEVVTDPVFTYVWPAQYAPPGHPLPYWMLYKQEEGWAMAAADGSWCTGFHYGMEFETSIFGWHGEMGWTCGTAGIFLTDGTDLVFLEGTTGRELLRLDHIPPEELSMAHFNAKCWWKDDRIVLSAGGGDYLWDGADGTLIPISCTAEQWEEIEGWRDSDRGRGERLDIVTGTAYTTADKEGVRTFYDEEGSPLATLPWTETDWYFTNRIWMAGGNVYLETGNYSGLLSPDGDWIFRWPLPVGEWD